MSAKPPPPPPPPQSWKKLTGPSWFEIGFYAVLLGVTPWLIVLAALISRL
jgi:hypothetical protein